MPAIPRPLSALCAGALAVAALGSATASAADPTVLGTTTRATQVGAAAGWTAWSGFENGAYVLVTRAPDGTLAHPAVAPRKVPFDLDLGIGAGGKVVAAYSRCTTEPGIRYGANATLPLWVSGRGCHIALLDLASGKERTVALGRGSASEVTPSLAGSTLALISVPKAKKDRRKVFLVVRDLRTGKSRTLTSGRRVDGPAGYAAGPTSVDTDDKRVVSIWRYMDTEFPGFNSDLDVQSVTGGKVKNVYGTANSESCNIDQLVGPTLTGGSVTYLETNGSDWQAERIAAGGGKPTFGPFSMTEAQSTVPTSAVVDGDRLVVADLVATDGYSSYKGPATIKQYALGTFVRKPANIEYCSG